MNSFDYYQPTEIKFGWGRISEIAETAMPLGKHALLVTGPRSSALGSLYERISLALKENDILVSHFDKVVPNPTTLSIDAGAQLALREKVDFVIGVGGGSSMDTAKAIAVGATHEGTAWDYRLFSHKKISSKSLPILAVSTTSGTGSQVTPFAVLTNPQQKSKFALADKNLFPRAAIVDPELMLTVPEHISMSTGFDAFAHAFESYIHSNASSFTDLLALAAMKLVVSYLPKVLVNGSDRVARSEMAWADTMAGLCIANAGTTLPHGIGMAIGGHAPGVMHGEALAAIYPEFMRYTYVSAVARFAALGRILDPRLESESDDFAAAKSCDLMQIFLERIGMHSNLKKLGIPREELPLIADDSVALPDYTVNPRVATRDEILEMVERSYNS